MATYTSNMFSSTVEDFDLEDFIAQDLLDRYGARGRARSEEANHTDSTRSTDVFDLRGPVSTQENDNILSCSSSENCSLSDPLIHESIPSYSNKDICGGNDQEKAQSLLAAALAMITKTTEKAWAYDFLFDQSIDMESTILQNQTNNTWNAAVSCSIREITETQDEYTVTDNSGRPLFHTHGQKDCIFFPCFSSQLTSIGVAFMLAGSQPRADARHHFKDYSKLQAPFDEINHRAFYHGRYVRCNMTGELLVLLHELLPEHSKTSQSEPISILLHFNPQSRGRRVRTLFVFNRHVHQAPYFAEESLVVCALWQEKMSCKACDTLSRAFCVCPIPEITIRHAMDFQCNSQAFELYNGNFVGKCEIVYCSPDMMLLHSTSRGNNPSKSGRSEMQLECEVQNPGAHAVGIDDDTGDQLFQNNDMRLSPCIGFHSSVSFRSYPNRSDDVYHHIVRACLLELWFEITQKAAPDTKQIGGDSFTQNSLPYARAADSANGLDGHLPCKVDSRGVVLEERKQSKAAGFEFTLQTKHKKVATSLEELALSALRRRERNRTSAAKSSARRKAKNQELRSSLTRMQNLSCDLRKVESHLRRQNLELRKLLRLERNDMVCDITQFK